MTCFQSMAKRWLFPSFPFSELSEVRWGQPMSQQPLSAIQFLPLTGGPITRGVPAEMSNGATR